MFKLPEAASAAFKKAFVKASAKVVEFEAASSFQLIGAAAWKKRRTAQGHLIAWAMKNFTTSRGFNVGEWLINTSASVGNMRGKANAKRAVTRNSSGQVTRETILPPKALL